MRVIAGSAKGKSLQAPAGWETTRPTADKVKEAIFGSIQFELEGSRVLDLFAGSGALGIEALSRGAAQAVLVDASREAVRAIQANLAYTGLAERAEVLPMDYARALARLHAPFDFIFLDPPYRSDLYAAAIAGIHARGLLAAEGLIIVEHDGQFSLEGEKVLKQKRYGKTFVSYIGGVER